MDNPLKNLNGKIALLKIRILLLCKEQRSLSGYINCTNCSGISLNNTAIRINNHLTLYMPSNFLPADFFQINFFIKYFQEQYQGVKWCRFR